MEKEQKKSVFLRLLTGFFIGLAAIAPGISGGAIAVIFGIYEPITDAISHIWQDFRQKAEFLWPLAVGGAAGILLFGKLINYLFLHYHDVTCALFIGLIVGTLPSVFQSAAKKGFHPKYLVATIACAAIVIWLTALEELQYTGSAEVLPYWLAVFCGAIVGFGSVLPGFSASFVLIALDVYKPMLNALDSFDIPRLLLLGVGFVGAVLLFTRLMSYLFKKAHGWMSFAVAGMLVGSLFNAMPQMTWDLKGVLLIALMAISAAFSYCLLRRKSIHSAKRI